MYAGNYSQMECNNNMASFGIKGTIIWFNYGYLPHWLVEYNVCVTQTSCTSVAIEEPLPGHVFAKFVYARP